MISEFARILPGVQLGESATVGDYVIIGHPARHETGETVIGERATIRSHTVIYAGNRIGSGFQTGHGVLIREENRIGEGVSIGSHTVVEHHVTIGDGVRIHSNAFIPEYSTLEAGAWVGPNVVFTNALYPLGARVKEKLAGPRLREGAKIGANATLLPAVTIGRHALVGAGAVVVDDVEDGAVVAGNPALRIKSVAEIPDYRD